MIILLSYVPDTIKPTLLTTIIFSDPAIFGFFFVGAILLLERDQNILESLFVTPLKTSEYFILKVISLSFLVLSVSLCIAFFTVGFSFNFFWLFLGVFLSATFFILLGLGVTGRVNSFNAFLVKSVSYMFVLSLPLFDYLNLFHTPIFYLFPTKAALILINAAFVKTALLLNIYAAVNLAIWITVAYFWAQHQFDKCIISRMGGSK
jgi:fluoroquinolone transport system permease protein